MYLKGRPTSRIILKNIRLLMERSNQTVERVRAVACERGLMVPLHRYFLALGFNEIHVQPAYDEAGISNSMSGPEMIELLAWYRQLLLEGMVLGIMPFEGILERLVHRRRAVTSWYPCTAGRSALGVGPDGRIYPCHHFLEVFAELAAARPDVLRRLAAKNFSAAPPQERAFGAQNLGPVRS